MAAERGYLNGTNVCWGEHGRAHNMIIILTINCNFKTLMQHFWKSHTHHILRLVWLMHAYMNEDFTVAKGI